MQSNFHSWILEDSCTEQFSYYTAKKGMRGRSTHFQEKLGTAYGGLLFNLNTTFLQAF